MEKKPNKTALTEKNSINKSDVEINQIADETEMSDSPKMEQVSNGNASPVDALIDSKSIEIIDQLGDDESQKQELDNKFDVNEKEIQASDRENDLYSEENIVRALFTSPVASEEATSVVRDDDSPTHTLEIENEVSETVLIVDQDKVDTESTIEVNELNTRSYQTIDNEIGSINKYNTQSEEIELSDLEEAINRSEEAINRSEDAITRSEEDDNSQQQLMAITQKEKKDEENSRLKTETQSNTTDSDSKSNDKSLGSADIKDTEQNKETTQNMDTKQETVETNEEQSEANKNLNAESSNETPASAKHETETEKLEQNTNNNSNETDQNVSKDVGVSNDGKEADTQPKKIVLAQTHYKTRTKSTLPLILAEYGLEDKNNPPKEKVKKKKKKRPPSSTEEPEDDDRRLRRARDEKFRQTFGDSRQTDAYYMEYIEFLEQKVVTQRLKIQKQKEDDEKAHLLRLEEEPTPPVQKVAPPVEEERKKAHHVKRRLERIELKHDDSFLKDIPKTDMARIVALQDKMKKDGRLKSQGDVDRFWNDIRKPDVFYAQFKVKKVDELSEPVNLPPAKGPLESIKSLDMPPRSLSHISEKDDKGESWAITQKFASHVGMKTPTEETKSRKSSAQLAKEAASDLERRCPKLEMPPLACFSLKLGEKPPDPEEIQRKVELKAREKTRKKSQRKLQRMYQMAMTNSAAANRILAGHGDLTNVLEGAALRDVLAVFDEPEPLYTEEDYYRDMGRMVEAHPEMDRVTERSSQHSSQPSTRQSSAGSHKLEPITQTHGHRPTSKSRRSKKGQAMIEYPEPIPLAFNEVFSREKTLEPKCVSTLWTNYMHAGKSVFAPS